ncbi:hypothetical protein L2E82_40142 [Cichorium intybus]|uniref:Uncharacterized protein n=1 Tax=Cichorium intybus TaxID=13427 RepID=A0ACB9AKX7_CICIN|nr:hypothetical protein L2E82_40142 [Cichorium intybus]
MIILVFNCIQLCLSFYSETISKPKVAPHRLHITTTPLLLFARLFSWGMECSDIDYGVVWSQIVIHNEYFNNNVGKVDQHIATSEALSICF